MCEAHEVVRALTSAGEQRHLQTIEHERCRHVGGGPPAEDPAGVGVEYERDVNQYVQT